MAGNAIGLIETSSIALGIRAADAMLKTAWVELLQAGAASPGKYLAVVAGDVAAVQAAVAAGVQAAESSLLDSLVIPNLHPQVYPAIKGEGARGPVQAVAVIETLTVAGAIRAADTAVKAAAVDLLQVRLARGLGGKGYLTVSGDVGSVQAAAAAAEQAAAASGGHLATVVIPAPHADLKAQLMRG